MPYLNLDLDYFTHPKVVRLVGILGSESVAVPIRLWCYVGKYHCATGILQGYSVGELESAVQWTGEMGKMVDALLKINLLEKIDGGYRVHDWLDHAGHLLAFKKRAKTAAKKRWKKIATSNASSTPKPSITNAPNHPNQPSLPNHPRKRKSDLHPMPENWSLTTEMAAHGASKGMTPTTIPHEFEACKIHHAESKFSVKGWQLKTWQTWVMKWVSYGRKQILSTEPSIPKSFRKLETSKLERSEMPQDVRDFIAKAGGVRGMPA